MDPQLPQLNLRYQPNAADTPASTQLQSMATSTSASQVKDQNDDALEDSNAGLIPEVEEIIKDVDTAEVEHEQKAEMLKRLDVMVEELNNTDFPKEKVQPLVDYLIQQYEDGKLYLPDSN